MAHSVGEPSISSNKWTVAQAPLPISFPTRHLGVFPLTRLIPTGGTMVPTNF